MAGLPIVLWTLPGAYAEFRAWVHWGTIRSSQQCTCAAIALRVFLVFGGWKMLKSAKKTVLVVSHPNKWCFRFGNVPVEFPSILIHLAGLSPFQICPTRWKALDVSFWVCVKTRTGFQHVWKKKHFSWTFSGFQERHWLLPIGSMYGIYTNIGCILMGSMLPYIAHMDPMG